MNIPTDRFGVNLSRFMKSYEADLLRQTRRLADEAVAPAARTASPDVAPETPPDPINLPALIACHQDVLIWMRHERLVHLIVTCLSAVLLMFVAGMDFVFKGHLALLVLLVIALALTLAYLIHYFRLENTVQRWHVYYFELLDLQINRLDNARK